MKMKSFLLFITTLMLLTACEKKYKYVETVKEQSILRGSSIQEKAPIIISASSDSSAYLEAFTKYCISQKVYNNMRKEGLADYLDVPIGFKLYDEDGMDITDISFATRLEEEERISTNILALDDVVNSNPTDGTELAESKIDSTKIEELLPFFNVNKDEFDPKGKTWYEPKSAPKYTNQNGIYLYFAAQEGKVLTSAVLTFPRG